MDRHGAPLNLLQHVIRVQEQTGLYETVLQALTHIPPNGYLTADAGARLLP